MGNRILRDCTDSEKMSRLDVYSERFFYRLIMVVDDYGRYYAHAGLLKGRMFPFLLDKIRETDITRWLADCQKAGLIVLYEVDDKNYLQIEDFRQRLDKAKEKYPPPITGKPITTDNDFPAETETETETKQKHETESEHEGSDVIPFDFFWNEYDKKVDREKCEKKWAKLDYETQSKILDYIPKYKLSQPEKNFRKNPETFLNNKSWLNELIIKNEPNSTKNNSEQIARFDALAERVNEAITSGKKDI